MDMGRSAERLAKKGVARASTKLIQSRTLRERYMAVKSAVVMWKSFGNWCKSR